MNEENKSKTELFIEKARTMHGEKYDYSKSNYTRSDEKLIIICPEHGEFEQIARSHLNGHGCAACVGVKKKTTEDFIIEAKAVHGNLYDYSKTNYIQSRKKLIIICPEHGEFEQQASIHLQGHHCAECAGLKRKTTEEFIKKAKTIHGDRFDYSKTEYYSIRKKIIIICPEHGEFEQLPRSHLTGTGCSACSNCKLITTEEFIKIAKDIHGDRYDYDKTNYIQSSKKVIIACSKHGDFEIRARSHLAGAHCQKCSNIDAGQNRKNLLTREQFIEKAKNVHGMTYDYDKVIYINNKTKVIINCKKHGEFEQIPLSHIYHRHGCPICGESKGERIVRRYFEKRNIKFIPQYRLEYGGRVDFLAETPSGVWYAVEFNGAQHYEGFSFGSKKENAAAENLAFNQRNDARKYKHLAEKEIPLLIIAHWEEDYAEEILDDTFFPLDV